MTVSINEESNSIIIDISGVIKGVADSQRLKDAIESIGGKGLPIRLIIRDSFAISSTIIGYLRKKIKLDGLNLSIKVGDNRLYELFEDLMLIDVFNVSKL